MDLEIFNDLIKNVKENEKVQNFMKELGESLAKGVSNKVDNIIGNNQSILDKFQTENDITVEYRDKMTLERNNILQNYAENTNEKGEMYYIYDKANGNYLVSVCELGKASEVIKLSENELPENAGIDSVLRNENGKYVLDDVGSNCVKDQMIDKFNELLNEQTEIMKEHRIEGHVYEFVESSDKSVWLIDNDANNGKIFEEFSSQNNLFDNAKEGDLYKYINGEYIKC